MNISKDGLLKLKCSECDCFLSRIPIYLKEDGSAICGRCSLPGEMEKLFRMKPYENLIENIKFPCMYESNGCPEQIQTTNLQKHEENCKFRPFVCPILPLLTCSWIGCEYKFYEHCLLEHSDRILEHPCVFKYDITRNSVESYVTKVYNVSFLIHTKVCMNTHKIYHSVHCLDFISDTSNTYFELVAQRGHEKIIKRGKVEPLGCRTIKENLSVSCGINSLIEIFDGFDDAEFTIKIVCTNNCKICNLISIRDNLVEGSYCGHCDEKRILCKYSHQGCTYKDIDIKTLTHERSLCMYTTWCWICLNHKVKSPVLTLHYELNHGNSIYKDKVYWNITENMFMQILNQFDFLIDSEYGRLYCTLFKFEKNYLIEICSSTLNTEEMCKLKCVVSIKNMDDIKEIPLVFYVFHKIDWYATFSKDFLFTNNSMYQIKVDILKN